jgi:hypothetical protein
LLVDIGKRDQTPSYQTLEASSHDNAAFIALKSRNGYKGRFAGNMPTVSAVLRDLLCNPGESLVRRWNWKSALLSSMFRSQIFFAANLTAGLKPALGAMAAEFLYRSLTSGFFGSLTQAFGKAEPAWLAAVTVSFLLPCVSHSIELMVHWLRGTPNLRTGIIASVCFTALSTTFNWYAMRKDVLVVGQGGRSLAADFRHLPRILAGFLAAGPVALWRLFGGKQNPC